MIHWEQVNPIFELTLPFDDMDIWIWVNADGWPEGWRSYQDVDTERQLIWSPSMPTAKAVITIRDSLESVDRAYDHTDHLVIYGPAKDDNVMLILVGTENRQRFRDLNISPPVWWFDDEGDEMRRFLARVRSRIEETRILLQRNRFAQLPIEAVSGYCSKCGLPKWKHVDHDPPDMKRPVGRVSLEEWQPFYAAFRKHYQAALRQVTDAELLKMPFPPSLHYLRVLAFELEQRIEKQPAPKPRLDHLLADHALDE